MRYLAGMFGHRRPAPPPAEPPRATTLPAAALERLAREAEEARRAAERRRASADAIARSCRLVGHWWPGMPVPDGPGSENRLSGRRGLREKAAELVNAIKDAWEATRGG
jgi:hypothetical protein